MTCLLHSVHHAMMWCLAFAYTVVGNRRSRIYRSSSSNSSSKLFTVYASKCSHKMQNSIAAMAITHLFNCSTIHAYTYLHTHTRTYMHSHLQSIARLTIELIQSFICAFIECRQFIFEYLLLCFALHGIAFIVLCLYLLGLLLSIVVVCCCCCTL